jgi:hypothetical protein
MSGNAAETSSLRSVRTMVLVPGFSLIRLLTQNTSEGQAQNDLVKAVDQLINNLGPKFSKVSAELFAKSE